MTQSPYLIAEIGVNHDGSVDRAGSMICDAAAAGFDAVKFQHWVLKELLAPGTPAAPYQGRGDQAAVLKGLVLDVSALRELSGVAREAGVDFIVTPDGVLALQEVLKVPVDALKIGSGDADNPFLLTEVQTTGLPLIVSLGMTDDDDVAAIVERLAEVDQLTLLHCVSAYPVAVSEARLARIPWLQETTQRPVGFSDHTIGYAAAAAATALGAVAIEKHVTWSNAAAGPDHDMSLDLAGAETWVDEIRSIATSMGSTAPCADEDANKMVVRKALYLRRGLDAGALLTASDLVPLRPLSDGIPALQVDALIGRQLARELEEGSIVRWSDLRP